MSETTKLNEVFKASTEVTSLGSNDRVLAVDANGNTKRITRSRAANPMVSSGTLSTAQWVRFASFTPSAAALLFFNSSWNVNPGLHMIVDVILHPHNLAYNHVAVLSRLSNTNSNVLSKLRVVINRNSTSYLDVYYNPSGNNTFNIALICGQNVTMLDAPILDAQVPDGFTVREFSLATVSDSAEIVGGG